MDKSVRVFMLNVDFEKIPELESPAADLPMFQVAQERKKAPHDHEKPEKKRRLNICF